MTFPTPELAANIDQDGSCEVAEIKFQHPMPLNSVDAYDTTNFTFRDGMGVNPIVPSLEIHAPDN